MERITDITRYRKQLDQFDLTEQQKLELVNALWEIVNNIYDEQLGIAEPMFEKKGKGKKS